MARCEEGYRCDVCGKDVELLRDSDLYLRFIVGEVDAELLHTTPERHLRCNPVLSQFIDHPNFTPVVVAGPMRLDELDPSFVQQRKQLITTAYIRLLALNEAGGDRDITTYPLRSINPPRRSFLASTLPKTGE
jgi:hypothetical protein